MQCDLNFNVDLQMLDKYDDVETSRRLYFYTNLTLSKLIKKEVLLM